MSEQSSQTRQSPQSLRDGNTATETDRHRISRNPCESFCAASETTWLRSTRPHCCDGPDARDDGCWWLDGRLPLRCRYCRGVLGDQLEGAGWTAHPGCEEDEQPIGPPPPAPPRRDYGPAYLPLGPWRHARKDEHR